MPNDFVKRPFLISLLTLCCLLAGALGTPDVVELGQRLKHAEKEERRLAAYQLQQMGESAAPAVRQLAKALSDDDDQVWLRATMTLAKIGPKAQHAIPPLVDQMGGNGARYAETRSRQSAYALSKIGEAAVPALLTALQDENEHRRWGAVHALGLIGEPAYSSLDAILKLLADVDQIVFEETVETCVAFGEIAVDQAADQLSAESDQVRFGAATILRRLSGHAHSQRDQVLAALIDEEVPAVRGSLVLTAVAFDIDAEFLAPIVTQALLGEEIEQDAAFLAVLTSSKISSEMVPKLALLLSDRDQAHRERAANLLGRLGASASPAAAALVARLQAGSLESSEEKRYLNALILIGSNVVPQVIAATATASPESISGSHWTVRALQGLAPIALPELEAQLQTASPSVACALLRALPHYSRRNRAVEKPVRAWLRSETEALRAGAVNMLGRLSLPSKVWIAAQTNALKDPSPEVRIAAITTLENVPVSNKMRLTHLTNALEDDERVVRKCAAGALGDLGSLAKEALPVLLASVQGPSPTAGYRNTVIEAFGKIGNDAESAVPYLRTLLHDEMDEATCLQSLRALAAIGVKAEGSIPEILVLCEHQAIDLRRGALEALGSVSDQAEQKIPVFLKALDDSSPDVRRPVIAGLGRLRGEAAPAAGRLVDLLNSEEDREAALDALREIRPEDLDLCLRLLKSENVGGRLLACDRLGRMKDRRALPELRAARDDDEHRYVRRRAREAISRIESAKK